MEINSYVNICQKCKSRNILFQIKNGKVHKTICKDCGNVAPFIALASREEEIRYERQRV